MKQKTHITPPKKSPINKQADILLRQIRMENVVKDLAKSNRRIGMTVLSSNNNNTTQPSTPAKSKKK